MIEIEIANTYTLPTSWDEVTLEQYVNILNANLDKVTSNILKHIKCLAILAGSPLLEAEIKQLDVDDLNTLLSTFAWINTAPEYESLPPVDTLEVDGVVFKIKKDFNKLNVDEVIIVEELTQAEQFDLHHFEIAFGMLFRKLDDQGNEQELTVDLLLNTILQFRNKVMLKDVFAVLAFFLSGDTRPSSQTSASCLPSQKKLKMNTQLKKK